MHASTEVNLYTEIRLYDFNAIVAAVGGSLGLFLGFSVLDSIVLTINSTFGKMKNTDYIEWIYFFLLLLLRNKSDNWANIPESFFLR